MTAYKVYLKILRKNLWLIVMYTVILGIFSVINMQSSNTTVEYAADKPSITLYNSDNSEFSEALVNYLQEKTTIKQINDENDDLNDAIYYSEVHLAVYIDEGFGEKLSLGEKPELRVRTTNGLGSLLSETILGRYVKIAQSFAPASQQKIIEKTNEVISHEAKVEVISKLDSGAMTNLTLYFNFLNYSLLAGLVFAITFATVGFKKAMVKKRMAASATNPTTINRQILLCNFAVSAIIWLSYIVIGYFIVGDSIFSTHGLLMILNSVFFTIFAVTFAFFLSGIVKKTAVLNPIINVVAIGSSFFCGVFLSPEWMPDFVLKIARCLPSYYYIDTNNKIAGLETINFDTLAPLLVNVGIVLASAIILIIINNIVTKKRQA
ncbi:ABC transporter permease [Candidatus Saccharibacteria bacterium]|nr:ABC transporter permease [Candidatus Saccharibacteria bacterium]